MEENNKEKNKFWESAHKSVDGIRRPEQQKTQELTSHSQIDKHPKLVGIPTISSPQSIAVVSDEIEPEKQLEKITELEIPILKTIEKSEIGNEIKIKKPHKKIRTIIGLLIFTVFLAGGSAIYFYQKSKKTLEEDNVAQQQLNETLVLVGKIASLPTNDVPVLAIVSDPSQLKADAFFDDSKVGDRVLIYPKIGRAFLYRPDTNQIINMMTFLPDSPPSTAQATSTVIKNAASTSKSGAIKQNQ